MKRQQSSKQKIRREKKTALPAEGRFLNILIGGEAGQGLQTVGTLFAKSLVRSGFSVHVTQTYESRVRGGHNTFSIRAGSEKVLAGQETIDILIALNEETIDLHRKELTKRGLIIGDGEWKRKEKNWIGLPLKEFGEKIYWNTACVGVAAGLIGLDEKVVAKTIEDTFGKERSEENWKILNMSYHWLKEQALEWEKLPAIPKPAKRLMMTGHEAVALGALSAGLNSAPSIR